MAKTKCIYGCGRFAKHYTPPRCRQCVSGRKPGRPHGTIETKPRKQIQQRESEIERRFNAAKAAIRARYLEHNA